MEHFGFWRNIVFSVLLLVVFLNGCGWKEKTKIWVQPKHWTFTDKTQSLDEMVRMPEKSSKGKVNFIWVDRNNSEVLFAGTDGGLFKSPNAGNEWFPINKGLTHYEILSFAQDPADPDHLYVGVRRSTEGVGGIFKSVDGGQSWIFLSNGPREFSVHSMFVDSSGVYAGSYGGGLFVSQDKGRHWKEKNEGLDSFGVYSLAKDPFLPNRLFAGTEKGLFVLEGQEEKWKNLPLGSGRAPVTSISFDALMQGKIYAGTEGKGIFISDDSGTHWKRVEKFKKGIIQSVLVLPPLPHLSPPLPVFASIRNLLLQSRDGGKNWVEMHPSPGFSFPPLQRENISEIQTLAFTPFPSNFLYTGWSLGRGIIGIPLEASFERRWVSLNNGLVNSSIMDLIVSKNNSSTVVAATWGSGLIQSEDGGRSWRKINQGFEGNIAHSIVEDPNDPKILYAGAEKGIYKSVDGGAHWQKVGSSIRRPIDIAIDPKNPDIVYAASWGEGFLKSIDGGQHWMNLSDDLEVPRAYSIAIDPIQTNILFLGTDYDLYKSTDGGQHWRALRVRPVQIVVLDPSDPSIVYAGTCKWIYKSTDGGDSWVIKRSGMKYTDVYSLAVDPRNPKIIYAGTYEGGMYLSVDGAENWSPISMGLSNKHVYSLAMDQKTPEVLFAGTFSATFASGVFKTNNGGSFWSLSHPGESEFTNQQWVSKNPFLPDVTQNFPSSTQGSLGEVFQILASGANP